MDGDIAGQHLGTVALGIRHVLCKPLRVVRYLEQSEAAADQRPIGVLYLDSREKGQLMSAAARNALEAVAGEAASAIESARLYREATEKARMERELRARCAKFSVRCCPMRCNPGPISKSLPRRSHVARSAAISSTTSICRTVISRLRWETWPAKVRPQLC